MCKNRPRSSLVPVFRKFHHLLLRQCQSSNLLFTCPQPYRLMWNALASSFSTLLTLFSQFENYFLLQTRSYSFSSRFTQLDFISSSTGHPFLFLLTRVFNGIFRFLFPFQSSLLLFHVFKLYVFGGMF